MMEMFLVYLVSIMINKANGESKTQSDAALLNTDNVSLLNSNYKLSCQVMRQDLHNLNTKALR